MSLVKVNGTQLGGYSVVLQISPFYIKNILFSVRSDDICEAKCYFKKFLTNPRARQLSRFNFSILHKEIIQKYASIPRALVGFY